MRLLQLLQRNSIVQKRQRRISAIDNFGPILESVVPSSDQPYQHPQLHDFKRNVVIDGSTRLIAYPCKHSAQIAA